ncbi:uncharacterized protein LOC143285880 [Babylonia areolata]|uniref:uncharacterized protein LOC143285880 n=1 Tax=Babylonia areolata TaxID=304850 RepID=UPI003FD2FB40
MKIKSTKSHSSTKRSASNRNHKMSNNVHADNESLSGPGSHISMEPCFGTDVPEDGVHHIADGDEAIDMELPEAVVLVGKTHWRCVTCMVLKPRTSSIDDHLNTHHRHPDSPAAVLPTPKRGRGRGRRVNDAISHAPRTPELDREQVLKSSVYPVEDAENEKTANEKESVWSSTRLVQKRRKTAKRGGRGRGKTRGWRGRGRVFTKPLTSEDSDTEIETPALSLHVKDLHGKRKAETSVSPAHGANESTDSLQFQMDTMTSKEEVSPPPNKKAKTGDDTGCDTAFTYEPAIENIPISASNMIAQTGENDNCDTASAYKPTIKNVPICAENVSKDSFKDLMKEKYVVFVGKGGTVDFPLDPEGHIDNDPPLPIETPSLQADAFLPPATPLLPDMHGPPETPILPETPHPPEVSHQPEPFHPSQASAVDFQVSTQSGMLSSITPAAAIATEHLSGTDEANSSAEQPLVSSHHFSSDGLMVSKSCEKEFASASVCLTCGAVFDSPTELRLHREEMVKFDVVSCNICGDKFHGLHQLNIHVFTTHEKFAKKFCFLCDVDCLDGFELEEHLLEHTSVETDGEEDANELESVQHTCKTCGAELEGNLSDLVNHYHTTHDQFVCARCYELFTDLTEYEDHKMLHCSHADGAVVYSCPVSDCFQLCEDKEALMNHISWHEDRDIDEEQRSLLQCQYCTDHFRNIVSLQRHLADTHNEHDLRPFVCELCRENFSHSLELHQHNAKQHAGIKRYGCAYCDQRFAFRSAHRRHVASEHDVAATVLRM